MRLVRALPSRLRNIAPEAASFAAIGALNTVVFFAVYNATLTIGGVKATMIATVVATTMSYVLNRYWTYRDRPSRAMRREYALFFAFNLAGMVIQSGVVGLAKYGAGWTEHSDRLAFNVAQAFGIALSTVFRFWVYRTFVFRSQPAIAVVDVPAQPDADEEFAQLTAELEAEQLTAEIEAEQLAASRRR